MYKVISTNVITGEQHLAIGFSTLDEAESHIEYLTKDDIDFRSLFHIIFNMEKRRKE